MELIDLAKHAAEQKASDLFIKADAPPMLRVNGKITATDFPVLTADEVRDLAYSIMNHNQIARFEHRHELDLAFTVEGVARFRANIYQQRGTIGAVLRLIPLEIQSLDDLGMPPVIK
ncbi:MAG: type IV pili twitching motility protein PilT, partial [Armatimonadota bacterium]